MVKKPVEKSHLPAINKNMFSKKDCITFPLAMVEQREEMCQ